MMGFSKTIKYGGIGHRKTRQFWYGFRLGRFAVSFVRHQYL